MNNADNATEDEPRITFEAAKVDILPELVVLDLGVAIASVVPSPVPGLIELPVSDSDAYREIRLTGELAPAYVTRRSSSADFVMRRLDGVATIW